MAHTLVDAYLDLPLGERDAALTSLVRSFGRREQALVQGLISDTRDPFYSLPTELLICVFDFLHPYDVWSKRLICRRWNDILSSDNFTRTALNRFDTHDPADSALDPKTQASSSHMLALRHILALRNGRPFSYVNYGDQFAFLPNSHPIAHRLQLKGKHIAYLRGNPDTREGNTVVIRDLVTGETTSLCGTAREKIMLIELSTDIVAFFTYVGTVYVASLRDLQDSLRAVRLPSSRILAAHADRGTLACLLTATSGLTIFIHDTETRKSTSFDYHRHEYCDENEDDHCHAVLINSHDKCIDILSVVNSTHELKLHVKVVRYSLTGERKSRDRLTIWHGIEDLPRATVGPILPTGERGLFQLALRIRELLHGTVLFDANFTPNTQTLKMVDLQVYNATLWKDRLYRSDSLEHDRFSKLLPTAQRPDPFDGPHSLRAMGNEAWSRPMSEDDFMQDNANDKLGVVPKQGRPSSLRSWILSTRRGYGNSRRIVMTHEQDQPDILPLPEPEPGMYRPPLPVRLPGLATYHTIVAMNETFAVATSDRSSYIGVMCFDERVQLHGAEATDLWAHANHPNVDYRPQHRDYKQIGPGFLDLDTQLWRPAS